MRGFVSKFNEETQFSDCTDAFSTKPGPPVTRPDLTTHTFNHTHTHTHRHTHTHTHTHTQTHTHTHTRCNTITLKQDLNNEIAELRFHSKTGWAYSIF